MEEQERERIQKRSPEEPDVEAHKKVKASEGSGSEAGRPEEEDEPDVEAHKLHK